MRTFLGKLGVQILESYENFLFVLETRLELTSLPHKSTRKQTRICSFKIVVVPLKMNVIA